MRLNTKKMAMELEHTRTKIPSLTEWLEKIDLPNIIEFRNEDNKKYDRLEKLKEIIGLNYNIPEKIEINDVINETKKFQKIEKKYSSKYDKCHWRLIPNYPHIPKHRIRSVKFEEAKNWLLNLKINPSDYKNLEIIKYSDKILFSAIFVVNNFGIW